MIPPYVETGLIHKAQKVATEGWELAPQVGDPEQRACLYVNRAGLLLKQDQPREAMASLALAEDMFRQLGWHGEGLGVTLMRALALLEDESYPEAETLLRDVLRGPEGSLTATDRAQALTHLARVSRLQGDPNEGLTHAREALVVGGHLAAVAAEAHRELGMCVAQTSSDESAVEHWQEALGLFQALQNKEEAAKTARLIGELLLEAGRPEAAASAFREGLSLLGQYR
jgi:tetratricopeptide (TPR) repeat protein